MAPFNEEGQHVFFFKLTSNLDFAEVDISFLCLFYQVILLSLPRTSSDNFPKIRGPENPRGLSHLHRMRTVEAQRGCEMDEGEYCSQVLFD